MKKSMLLLFFALSTTALFAQEQTITGILEDNGEVLIGANVLVNRNGKYIHGTITDIDGKYSIQCQVGDVVTFSYVGYTTQSITVTEAMLQSKNSNLQKIKIIRSKEFQNNVQQRKQQLKDALQKIASQKMEINQVYHPNYIYHHLNDFDIKKEKLHLTYLKNPIKYGVTIQQKIGVQSIMPYHKFQLQQEYSQGRPINGQLTYQDYDAGEAFSFGPRIENISNTKAYENNLFSNGLILQTKLNLQYERDNRKTYMKVNFKRSPDIFNVYNESLTEVTVGMVNFEKAYYQDNNWHIQFNAKRYRNGNHNYNGNYHNVIKSLLVQSPSFNVENGIENNKSFSPGFDHPLWLLNNSRNEISIDYFSLFGKHNSKGQKYKLSNIARLEYESVNIYDHFNQDGSKTSNRINVDMPKFELSSDLTYQLIPNHQLQFIVQNSLTAMHADFESSEFQQQSTNHSSQLLRNNQTASIKLKKKKYSLAAGINLLVANNQPNEYLNPLFVFNTEFTFRKKKIDNISTSMSIRRQVKNMDLLLDRYNYSSLNQSHENSQDLRLDIPLWLPIDLQNEIQEEFSGGVELKKRYSNSTFTSQVEYKYVNQKNVIFPVLDLNQWSLQNAADYTLQSISWITNWNGYEYIFDRDITFNNTLEIKHFRTNVTKIKGEHERIPIAGFANISKNLMVGEPVGIIVGSDFNRNSDGELIIAEDGFPTKADKLKIIADPTPLFTFALGQKIIVDNYSLNVIIDGQVGGQVWNGTQQVLDYYGVSQHSADLRNVEDFIFEGVDAKGSINTIPVAFADPELGLEGNRWARYGQEGVASDYIRSASHIRLKSIEFSYTNDTYFGHNKLKISVYAKNLFTISPFRGFTTSHLFEDSIAQGIQYFNQPIASEIGMSFTYKL